MVLVGHSGYLVSQDKRIFFDMFSDGNLGVRFFFVISGFLITWLLLKEFNQTEAISLKDFYIRRFLRILPIYFAFVLVLVMLQMFTHFKETRAGWLGMLTFTRNYVDASGPSGHLWSLAVEEQFYLIWPSLLFLICRCTLRAKLLVLAIPILSAPFFRARNYILYHSHNGFLHHLDGFHLQPAFLNVAFYKYSFFCYYDSLAVGCLAAIWLANKNSTTEKIIKKSGNKLVALALCFIIIPHVAENFPYSINQLVGAGFTAFGATFQAVGFGFLLIHSLLEPRLDFYRVLNWKWVVWIGVLSYSLYIWQQIFFSKAWRGELTPDQLVDPLWAVFWVLPVFGVAMISYYGLERPLLKLRFRFRHA